MITLKAKKSFPKTQMCFCRCISPSLTVARVLGFFPIMTYHKNGTCIFQKSNYWICYSVLVNLMIFVGTGFNTELCYLYSGGETKSTYLNLTETSIIVNYIYVSLLMMVNTIQTPSYVKAFNSIAPVIRKGLFCQKIRRIILKTEYILIGLCLIASSSPLFVVCYYWIFGYTRYNVTFYLNLLIHNYTILSHVIHNVVTSILYALLSCLQKMMIIHLNYRPLRTSDEHELQNKVQILNITISKGCGEDHIDKNNLKSHEWMDYLRQLHEHVCVIQKKMNNSLNPQLLICLLFECTTIVINCYSLVLFYLYSASRTKSYVMHSINYVFLISHVGGLVTFLNNEQKIENLVSTVHTI